MTELYDVLWTRLPHALIVALGYAVLLRTSGPMVNLVLKMISDQPVSAMVTPKVRETGMVIGKCENFLILTFMMLDAYIAISLIFTAKGIIRREDMIRDSTYYLAGTLVNVTWSVLIALAVKLGLALVH